MQSPDDTQAPEATQWIIGGEFPGLFYPDPASAQRRHSQDGQGRAVSPGANKACELGRENPTIG
jgi:hypothetical protein